jgi:hypothetical protein
MRISTECKKCSKVINTFTSASDRVELARMKGEKFKMKCKYCNSEEEYHVDDFEAEKSKLAMIMALLIFIIGTPLVIIFFKDILLRYSYLIISGLVLIPGIIYGLIMKTHRERVYAFNSHKLSMRG